MALLVVHGCAGVLWEGPTQMLLHDTVPAPDLPSGVRLLATARYLGVLIGPAAGGAIMLTIGPRYGLLLNLCFYLPALLWLSRAPYGPRFRSAAITATVRAVRGLADLARAIADVRSSRALASMILLAGLASFFVANSYQAQMPGFARDLGHGDPGTTYSMLLAADAAGALIAGLLMESLGGVLRRDTFDRRRRRCRCGAPGLLGFAFDRLLPLGRCCCCSRLACSSCRISVRWRRPWSS